MPEYTCPECGCLMGLEEWLSDDFYCPECGEFCSEAEDENDVNRFKEDGGDDEE